MARASTGILLLIGLGLGGGSAIVGSAIAEEVSVETEGTVSEAEGRQLGLREAIETALANNPQILIAEASVDAARGGLMVESGVFDPGFGATLARAHSDSPSTETTSVESETLAGTVDGSWQLRSGRSLETAISLDWLDQESATSSPGTNTASVSFTLRQPLMRGRRSEVVVGGERAAERELLGTQLDLAHTTASTLRDVVSQYWRVRAAMIDVEVLRDDEHRSRELLAQTHRLVEAQLTPAADLLQLEADLISVEALRIGGEAALFREMRLLAEAMGLDAEEAALLPMPGDPLPDLGTHPELPSASDLLGVAYETRGDLLASRERLQAAELQLQVAEDEIRPQLDLVLTPSYEGLVDGNDPGDWISPLYSNVPGLSFRLGVSYAWPVGNRAAEGARIQAEAGVRQRQLLVEQLRQDIGSRVPIALETVTRTIVTLEKLERAIDLFEMIVENEIKKLRAGQSTLLDLIFQQDRLVTSQQNRVQAQLALAIALVDLRFETGTLLDFDPTAFDPTVSDPAVSDSAVSDPAAAGTPVLGVDPTRFVTLPNPR